MYVLRSILNYSNTNNAGILPWTIVKDKKIYIIIFKPKPKLYVYYKFNYK